MELWDNDVDENIYKYQFHTLNDDVNLNSNYWSNDECDSLALQLYPDEKYYYLFLPLGDNTLNMSERLTLLQISENLAHNTPRMNLKCICETKIVVKIICLSQKHKDAKVKLIKYDESVPSLIPSTMKLSFDLLESIGFSMPYLCNFISSENEELKEPIETIDIDKLLSPNFMSNMAKEEELGKFPLNPPLPSNYFSLPTLLDHSDKENEIPIDDTSNNSPKIVRNEKGKIILRCPNKYCNRTYVSRYAFQKHLSTHENEDSDVPKRRRKKKSKHSDWKKTFKCSLCKRSFRHAHHLTAHEKIHLKQALHSCNVCHADFSRKIQLNRHMKTHEVDNNETKSHGKENSDKFLMEEQFDVNGIFNDNFEPFNIPSFDEEFIDEYDNDHLFISIPNTDSIIDDFYPSTINVDLENILPNNEMDKNFTTTIPLPDIEKENNLQINTSLNVLPQCTSTSESTTSIFSPKILPENKTKEIIRKTNHRIFQQCIEQPKNHEFLNKIKQSGQKQSTAINENETKSSNLNFKSDGNCNGTSSGTSSKSEIVVQKDSLSPSNRKKYSYPPTYEEYYKDPQMIEIENFIEL
ncbi:hypothetical protein SNEBB_007652 [Seison nebaliae]|nr:hypothetical protein SNEBB_007652 [Seison nebaliae]